MKQPSVAIFNWQICRKLQKMTKLLENSSYWDKFGQIFWAGYFERVHQKKKSFHLLFILCEYVLYFLSYDILKFKCLNFIIKVVEVHLWKGVPIGGLWFTRELNLKLANKSLICEYLQNLDRYKNEMLLLRIITCTKRGIAWSKFSCKKNFYVKCFNI